MPSADIAGRADRNQHPLVVGRERDVAGRMAVAGRQLRNDLSPPAGGLQIAAAIGKAHDAVGVGDIDPLRVVAARKERDAERAVKAAGEDFVACRALPHRRRHEERGCGRRCVSATKISPFGATRMMRGPLKPSANNSILKPGRDLRRSAGRPRHDTRETCRRRRRAGFGQILRPDQADRAGLVGLPAAEGVLAFARGRLGGRRAAQTTRPPKG